MAESDYHKKYGEEIMAQMPIEKRFVLVQGFIEKYMKEFYANGIEYL